MIKLRLETVDRSKTKEFINPNKQQFIGILGTRGEGKSRLLEALMFNYYQIGFTLLDLWSAPNFENYFWCIANEGHKKRLPITILAPESLIDPKEQVDSFNLKFQTQYPLIKIVKLPFATAKFESDTNYKIVEILTQAIIECRNERRILCFNPKIYTDEATMFRTLEILFRSIDKIAYDHFNAIEPSEVGKTSYKEMTLHQKNHHKIIFCAREFGEIAPARMKGDKSGQSTLIKKAQLKLFRLARHSQVSGIIDYQNATDAESSIRHQIDVWAVKGWSRELAGENFQWIFDKVEAQRKMILEKKRYSRSAKREADSAYPPIEIMAKTWFYGFNATKFPRLLKVPELPIKHKEPTDKWDRITGITLEHDQEILKKATHSSKSKVSKSDEKNLFNLMKELHTVKKLSWDDTRLQLAELQEKGEITATIDFGSVKYNQLGSKYTKLKKKYEK